MQTGIESKLRRALLDPSYDAGVDVEQLIRASSSAATQRGPAADTFSPARRGAAVLAGIAAAAAAVVVLALLPPDRPQPAGPMHPAGRSSTAPGKPTPSTEPPRPSGPGTAGPPRTGPRTGPGTSGPSTDPRTPRG